jgi:hypothetical protein
MVFLLVVVSDCESSCELRGLLIMSRVHVLLAERFAHSSLALYTLYCA